MHKGFLEDIMASLKETDAIRRVRWTPEQLKEWFATRTVEDILKDGTTHYANPCADLTAVLKYRLQERGHDTDLYVEVVENKLWNPQGNIGVHFGLRMINDGQPHYLHIKTHNQTILGKGLLPADDREEVTRVALYLLPGTIDPKKNLMDNYPQMQGRLPVRLEAEIARLIEHDQPHEFSRYEQRLNGYRHLYLDKLL